MIVVNKSACLFLHRCTRLSTNVKILRLWMVVVILIRLSDRLHACLSVNSSIWKCVTWPVGRLVLFWPRVQLCADEKLLQCFPAVTYLWPKFSYYLNCPTFYALSSCRSLSPFVIFAKLNVVTVQHITLLLWTVKYKISFLYRGPDATNQPTYKYSSSLNLKIRKYSQYGIRNFGPKRAKKGYLILSGLLAENLAIRF